jgi:hypothetical protein
MAMDDTRSSTLTAVTLDGGKLRYAPAALRDDADFILLALDNSFKLRSTRMWEMLSFASKRLRDDAEFVLRLVSKEWLAFQFASDRLRGDSNIALAALAQDSYALRWVSPQLKNDLDFIVAAAAADAQAAEWGNTTMLWNEDHKSKHLEMLRSNFRVWKHIPLRMQVQDSYIIACASNHSRSKAFNFNARRIQKTHAKEQALIHTEDRKR